MASLEQVLASIPGLAGYQAQVNQNNATTLGNLQQGQAVGGILAQIQKQAMNQQAMQEQQQLKGLLAQSGGDPANAVKALLQSGNPQAIGLAAKLHSLIPAPEKPQQIGAFGLRMPSGEIIPPVQKPAPERFSNLQRLLTERNALSPDDPNRAIYDNAIRKESETARQISPTIVMPRQEAPVQTYTDGAGNLFERSRGGAWAPAKLEAGAPEMKPKPAAGISGANNNAMRLRGEYNSNPEVKLANSLEPRIGAAADYVASVGKGMGNSVGDAELVKLWLMTTHPKGDQISNMDYGQIAKMPDLMGRVGNIAGNFVFGKTLDGPTRNSMWKSVSEKYKATDAMRSKAKADVSARGRAMNLNEEAIFSTPAE